MLCPELEDMFGNVDIIRIAYSPEGVLGVVRERFTSVAIQLVDEARASKDPT